MPGKTPSREDDVAITATSALIGGVATLIQELIASKAIDPDRLQDKLRDYAQQERVQSEPPLHRSTIEDVIRMLMQGIEVGKQELQDNERQRNQ